MIEGVREERLQPVMLVLGLSQLALGAFQAIAPGTFFDALGDFGTQNDHYMRDISTYYLALGAALLVAASRPSWRVPVLGLATAQYGLHSINHLFDVGEADPGWVGPLDLVSLVLFTMLLGYVWAAAGREAR